MSAFRAMSKVVKQGTVVEVAAGPWGIAFVWSGHGTEANALAIVAGMDRVSAGGKRGLALFLETSDLVSYDSTARSLLTDHVRKRKGTFTAIHAVTRSTLVAMGAAVANLALGGLIHMYQDVADYRLALDKVRGRA